MLAYCIVEREKKIDVPRAGVEGAPIRWLDIGVLRCFLSDFGGQMPREPVPEMVKAFNQVLQRIFAQTAIIPFRFPTVVEKESVLSQFVGNRSSEYKDALRRLRDKVQMDVRISLEPDGAWQISMQSGKSYLQEKRARHQEAQSILNQFRGLSQAEAWIEREAGSGIRAFALVDRSRLSAFLQEIVRVHTPVGISARVTGPWPPSEFVEIAHE